MVDEKTERDEELTKTALALWGDQPGSILDYMIVSNFEFNPLPEETPSVRFPHLCWFRKRHDVKPHYEFNDIGHENAYNICVNCRQSWKMNAEESKKFWSGFDGLS